MRHTTRFGMLALAVVVAGGCGSSGPTAADLGRADGGGRGDGLRADGGTADRGGDARLPADGGGTPFSPNADTTLAAGQHAYSSFTIPEGVTVTLEGDVVIEVSGEVTIAGTLRGSCTRIEIHGGGNIAITGTIDNRCPQAGEPADLIIWGNGGNFAVGSASKAATLDSLGNIDLSADSKIKTWEFDVLPYQRSASKLPPVCSARVDSLLGLATAGQPHQVALSGSGADPDGGEVTYRWDFGDASEQSGKDLLHDYTHSGSFVAILTVTDDDGEKCQAKVQLAVGNADAEPAGSPAAWSEPAALVVDVGQQAQFASLAEDPEATALTYQWSFGDGGSSGEAAPTHTYSAPGRYQVSLTVTDEGGRAPR